MNRPLHLFTVISVAAAAQALAAQAHDHGRPEQLGRVVFPVSCNAAAAQRFERAMALLHSFWWEQGVQAFRDVAGADSTCAMAYWGSAMNAWGNPFAGGPSGQALAAAGQAAERAAAIGGKTARERGFISAVATLYRDHGTVPNVQRLRAYSDTMARVYRDNPGDVEVAIYYALSLVATAPATDTTFTRQKQAAAILNPLFQRFPQHPGLAHYIIHANDSPRLASLGLDAARRYAQIAPSAPHAQHMPSHIFIRLGLWDDNIASNQRSYDAGVAYAKAQGLSGVLYHEFHALDYMVYGYLQLGQDAAAGRIAAHADSLSQSDGQGGSAFITSYNRSALAARVAVERSDWAGAASLPIPAAAPATLGAVTRFARGIGAARAGDTTRARAEVTVMAELETAATAGTQGAYWSRVIGIKRRAIEAWLALAASDTAGALRLAREAADMEDVTEKHPVTPGELLPARELLGDMLLAIGRYADARIAYDATLVREPRRARAIFGAARAAELAGDRATARRRYDEFLAQMKAADGDRAEIARAREALR